VDGSIECANEVFGTDPLFKQGKECQCKQGATTTSTTTTTTTATSMTTSSEATTTTEPVRRLAVSTVVDNIVVMV